MWYLMAKLWLERMRKLKMMKKKGICQIFVQCARMYSYYTGVAHCRQPVAGVKICSAQSDDGRKVRPSFVDVCARARRT